MTNLPNAQMISSEEPVRVPVASSKCRTCYGSGRMNVVTSLRRNADGKYPTKEVECNCLHRQQNLGTRRTGMIGAAMGAAGKHGCKARIHSAADNARSLGVGYNSGEPDYDQPKPKLVREEARRQQLQKNKRGHANHCDAYRKPVATAQ